MFIVTGGGSGIGRALAYALAKRSKPVLIIGRREKELTDTAALSPLISTLCTDVSTANGRAVVGSYIKDRGHIDALIHNAGIIEPILPISVIGETAWRQAMGTNVDAPLFLTQLLYDKLTHGRVLHMGSGASNFPVKGWAAYCVSKAALSMLTRCWQLESKDVAFASVMPGIIDTPMQEKIRDSAHMESDKLDFFKQLKEEKQLLLPDTVALFLCWLLLDIDKSEFVSKEWDIYDTTHHHAWLVPPHQVPPLGG